MISLRTLEPFCLIYLRTLFEGYGLYFILLKLKNNLPFAVFEEICWRLAGNEAAQNSNGRQWWWFKIPSILSKSLIFYSLVTYQHSIIIIIIINHCLFLDYQALHYNKTFEVSFIALWWFSYFMPSPLPRLLFTLFATSKNLYLGCFLYFLPSPLPWLLFTLFFAVHYLGCFLDFLLFPWIYLGCFLHFFHLLFLKV